MRVGIYYEQLEDIDKGAEDRAKLKQWFRGEGDVVVDMGCLTKW
jgi:hypothetical protein